MKERMTAKDETKRKPTKLRRFLYVVAWVILLPIVIGLPAAMGVGAIIVSTVISAATDDPSRMLFYIELNLFLTVSGIVALLYLVKWFLRTRKHLSYRIGGTVLGVYIWLGIILTASFMVVATDNPGIARPPVVHDDKLMAVLEEVGGDAALMRDVSIKYVKRYKDKHQLGEYQPVLESNGEFSYGTITIKKGLSDKEQKSTVAHEYLHHVWETQLDEQTRHDLTSQLMTLYGKDDWFKTRVATYSDTNMLIPTELFAFYCTESADKYLTRYVLKQCNTYINRQALDLIRP